MLEGTSYTICTDHKPLVTALSKTSDAWTSRQQRHLSTIAETCCTIEYLPGKQNAVADALSRVEISTIQLGVNYEALSAAQLTDPETEDAKTSITNLRWKVVKIEKLLYFVTLAPEDRGHLYQNPSDETFLR